MKPIKLPKTTFVPDGWTIEEDTAETSFVPDFELYLEKGQWKGIEGNKLRKLLKGKPVMGARVLDYLLANPHLIPEEWKGQYVFFWGTVYRRRDGSLCVRYLYWSDGGWDWGHSWLDSGWDGNNPSALRASTRELGALPSDTLDLAARLAKVEAVLKYHNLTPNEEV